MPTIIKLKRSEIANRVPSASDMVVGEIAMNSIDGKLFTLLSTGIIVQLANNIDPYSNIDHGSILDSDYGSVNTSIIDISKNYNLITESIDSSIDYGVVF